ncbi:MAG: hypothetical protein P4L84_37885 [Isosphaeraceae bacterium]|nr:hypothetical protein [Isosphaeraceae bacterium]
MDAAVTAGARPADTGSTAVDTASGPPPTLAFDPNILGSFARSIAETVAGESRIAKVLYLAVTTRLLDRPVPIAVKGPSSAGKNYLVRQVLSYFPPAAYHELTGMSERALVYDDTPLAHRFLVVYEAAGVASEMASYLVRSLVSEGRVSYLTVEKTKDGLRGRTIVRQGPTGLIVTTTALRLHPENETRMLSLTVTDTPAQTRAVMLAQAGMRPVGPGREPWKELQEWLAAGTADVDVPFAITLARAIPAVTVRLRRDFPAILSLVRAHALLHRATRSVDAQGRIVATLRDYAVVRELVADLISESAEQSVPDSTRDTVRAVADLIAKGKAEPDIPAVARALGLDQGSTTWRRVQVAIGRRLLLNLEERPRRPARLALGEPLPEDESILPTAETLERLVARTHTPSETPLGTAFRVFGDDLAKPSLRDCVLVPGNTEGADGADGADYADIQSPGADAPAASDAVPVVVPSDQQANPQSSDETTNETRRRRFGMGLSEPLGGVPPIRAADVMAPLAQGSNAHRARFQQATARDGVTHMARPSPVKQRGLFDEPEVAS